LDPVEKTKDLREKTEGSYEKTKGPDEKREGLKEKREGLKEKTKGLRWKQGSVEESPEREEFQWGQKEKGSEGWSREGRRRYVARA